MAPLHWDCLVLLATVVWCQSWPWIGSPIQWPSTGQKKGCNKKNGAQTARILWQNDTPSNLTQQQKLLKIGLVSLPKRKWIIFQASIFSGFRGGSMMGPESCLGFFSRQKSPQSRLCWSFCCNHTELQGAGWTANLEIGEVPSETNSKFSVCPWKIRPHPKKGNSNLKQPQVFQMLCWFQER